MKKKSNIIINLFLLLISSCSHDLVCQPPVRPLKILFVLDKFPYSPRQYVDNQITGLIDLGHEVYILAKKVSVHDDYPLVREYNLLQRTFYESVPSHMKDFDILYCQFGKIGNYCLSLVEQKKLSGKIAVCFRGGDASKDMINNPLIYKKLFKKADLLMPVCYNFKKNIMRFGAKPHKILIHHSAIDCSKFEFTERKMPVKGPVKIITVARLSRMKGIDYAIRAFKKLSILFPDMIYEIIGEGVEHDNLNQLIEDLNLQNRVFIMGYLPHDQVIEKLNQAHIFLLTSNIEAGAQEGIPNAAMEAMASGLPIIATSHSGLRELIRDGVSGFLVPERAVDRIADRLLHLLKHPQLWSKMGIVGRQHVLKEHNKTVVNEKLVKIFRSLL